jgi:hypothetical protein
VTRETSHQLSSDGFSKTVGAEDANASSAHGSTVMIWVPSAEDDAAGATAGAEDDAVGRGDDVADEGSKVLEGPVSAVLQPDSTPRATKTRKMRELCIRASVVRRDQPIVILGYGAA